MKVDYAYFRGRASDEREAAAKATHPGAIRSHLELALRCEELATRIEAQMTSDKVSSLDDERKSAAAIERLVDGMIEREMQLRAAEASNGR